MSNALATLPRSELIARLLELVRRGNAVEADLLAHVAEVDARRLYLDEGCPSMFAYCQRVLGFAEGVAYKRIQVARAARRFPEILTALRRGELHLTGLCLLAPKLDAHNASELIRASRHRSTDEIRRLLADRDPKPDVLAAVRRLSAPPAPAPLRPATKAGPGAVAFPTPRPAPTPPAPARPAHTEPLGAERYHVQFTADRALYEQLQELRALMRHQVPDGDLAAILARAVGVLLKQVRKRKFAETETPRPVQPVAPDGAQSSRHIPAAIRRAVWKRDGGRCTFVSSGGRRCGAREFLEFDHTEAWVRRRVHTTKGITLRCHGHNQHRAQRDFGERHMARRREGEAGPRANGSGRPGAATTRQLDSNQVGQASPGGDLESARARSRPRTPARVPS